MSLNIFQGASFYEDFFKQKAVRIPPFCYSSVVYTLYNTFNPSSTAEEEKKCLQEFNINC